MKALCILLSLMLVSAAPVFSQGVQDKTPPPSAPDAKVPDVNGPPVSGQWIRGSVYTGELAPDFELPASTGHLVKLSSFRSRWTLLVFAERKEGLAPLASIRDQMLSMGVQMVGVCDEKAYYLVAFAAKGGPPFPMLGDVTGEISALYGLYDAKRETTEPGFFMIDPEGKVRLALLGQQLRPADIASLARYAVKGM